MGKSTTAAMFADHGLPVWDADAAVRRLYAQGGAAVAPIGRVFPAAIKDGAVSKKVLKGLIESDPSVLKKIEKIVHPLVAEDRALFLRQHEGELVLLDIPLLFETGGDKAVNKVVVVSAPAEIQRARVLERGTMSEAEFGTILAKQVPDAEKRRRADYVVETTTIEEAERQVAAILEELREELHA